MQIWMKIYVRFINDERRPRKPSGQMGEYLQPDLKTKSRTTNFTLNSVFTIVHINYSGNGVPNFRFRNRNSWPCIRYIFSELTKFFISFPIPNVPKMPTGGAGALISTYCFVFNKPFLHFQRGKSWNYDEINCASLSKTLARMGLEARGIDIKCGSLAVVKTNIYIHSI
ncbi:protein of unknown function [Azospirillum lipoferum 4B]|uniref:Uncharacterized protein n=1 Tax=Azospirillum lipoferum (strain 4B) TaxID=862719 RepID=G7Z6I2_AZOL4|nr:protein of unknown function [Azospirillum lipoferum 4B]